MKSWSESFADRAGRRKDAERRFACGFVMTDEGPVTARENPELFFRELMRANRL